MVVDYLQIGAYLGDPSDAPKPPFYTKYPELEKFLRKLSFDKMNCLLTPSYGIRKHSGTYRVDHFQKWVY